MGTTPRAWRGALSVLSFLTLAACSGTAEDAAGTPPASADLEVAEIRLGEGRSARFFAVAGGVLVEETGPQGVAPVLAASDERGAVELYLSLAPADAPIPAAIAALAEDAERPLVAGRATVERLAQPLVAAPGSLRTQDHDGQTGTYSCNGGAAAFEAFACEGSGTRKEFCDSGAYTDLARNSGDLRVKRSLGVFVACGTHVQIAHQYRDCCSDWRHLHTSWVPGGHWMSSRYTGAAKWRRRVEYDRVYQPSGSYLRAYSAFY